MSDVFTKRRPMIDWDEFEKRLCRPCSTDQMDGEPLAELAELLRIIESNETDFEPKTPLSDAGEPGESNQPDAPLRLVGGDFASIEAGLLGTKQPEAAMASEAERSTAEDKMPSAQGSLISGDFAAIEAGLLGIPREQATATVSEANMSNAFSSGDIGSHHFLPQDNQLSRYAGVAEGQNRSRRPLYAMVAIVIVAMAGIAVGFGLKSRASGPPEIASIKVENGAAKLNRDIASGVNAPAQAAAISTKPPEPGTERTLELPKVEEKTLPAESHAQIDNQPPAVPSAPAQVQTLPAESHAQIDNQPPTVPSAPAQVQTPAESHAQTDNGPPAVPPVPAQAQTPTEPLSMAALIGPEKMKNDLVRQDATLPPNDTLPQANIHEAPLPAPQSPVAAKASKAKAVGRAAKIPKPTAARDPGGLPRQIAKGLPVSRPNSEPAPIGDPTAVTPTIQPSPANNGPFGFVLSAVNSLTSATAKLLGVGTN